MPGDVRAAVAQRGQPQADVEKVKNFDAFVTKLGDQMKRVLPAYIPEDRMVRLAMSAARSNSRILECTQISVAGALMTAASLGLEPETPLGECYVIPYRDTKRQIVEAEFVMGYQGLVKLFFQHPSAYDCDAVAVYPEDEFWWQKGTTPLIHHVPKARDEASTPTHYYGVVWLKGNDRPHFEVLTAEQVKTLRKGKVGPQGDIPDPEHWMERKTALKQALKLTPKSVTLATAMNFDEQSGTDLYAGLQRAQAQRLDVPNAIDGATAPPPDEPPVEEPPPGGEGL